jgi:hypothetical protein
VLPSTVPIRGHGGDPKAGSRRRQLCRGFGGLKCFSHPTRQVTEGIDVVTVDLSGEIYGAISAVTAFSAGTES